MYQSINPFRTVSYVWGALRRHFPEDVVTMIYYLLNTVVQFLQQCVHHIAQKIT